MKARTLRVDAKPNGIWTAALDTVHGIRRLRIVATGTWSSGTEVYAPDGKRASVIPRSACLLTTAPFGALIGKIGGSTAGLSDGYLFPIGSSCVLDLGVSIGATSVPATGALYLTINDTIEGLDDNAGHIDVTLTEIAELGES